MSRLVADYLSRYIKTPIITEVVNTAITTTDTGYATVEDAGSALLRIVSDSNVQGQREIRIASACY